VNENAVNRLRPSNHSEANELEKLTINVKNTPRVRGSPGRFVTLGEGGDRKEKQGKKKQKKKST